MQPGRVGMAHVRFCTVGQTTVSQPERRVVAILYAPVHKRRSTFTFFSLLYGVCAFSAVLSFERCYYFPLFEIERQRDRERCSATLWQEFHGSNGKMMHDAFCPSLSHNTFLSRPMGHRPVQAETNAGKGRKEQLPVASVSFL